MKIFYLFTAFGITNVPVVMLPVHSVVTGHTIDTFLSLLRHPPTPIY